MNQFEFGGAVSPELEPVLRGSGIGRGRCLGMGREFCTRRKAPLLGEECVDLIGHTEKVGGLKGQGLGARSWELDTAGG